LNRTAFSIYDASAGSGKTFTLAKEYLKILLTSKNDEAYRNILAITFTNKAVAEMKKRIINYLHEFASNKDKISPMMSEIIAETNLDSHKISEKAKVIIKNIIHNYAAFDVMTIDKFTSRVIRTFAFDLNLSPNFDITLDTDLLIDEAVEALIANTGNEASLTKLLVDFAIDKTDDDKSWDVSRDLKEMAKLLLNENHKNEINLFEDKSLDAFDSLKITLLKNKDSIEKEMIRLVEDIHKAMHSSNVERESFSYQSYPKSLDKVIKSFDGFDEKYLNDAEGFKTKNGVKDTDVIKEMIPFFIIMNHQINKLAGKRKFILAILKNLTPMSLLQVMSKEFKGILNEKNQLSISDFNTIINNELQNQPAPFIYERIGEYYKHYFIDEFQDTSVLQWNNLIPLINNSLSSEDLQGQRGSLMIVGDPKQSIYRFRGGRAEQLIRLTKEENPFSNKDKKVFHLNTNWRSYDNVIKFNNDFFKFISGFFENTDYKELYEKYSIQKSRNLKGGYVNLSFAEQNETEEEESILQINKYLQPTFDAIQKCIIQGFEFKDIAILTRKNNHGSLLANYLVQKNIPVLSSESLIISQSAEVSFLVSFLKFIENSENKEALAEVFYYLSNEHFSENEVNDFIVKGLNAFSDKRLDDWFSDIHLDVSIKKLKRKSLYEVVEFLMMNLIPFDKRDAYVQDFLDRVLEQEIKNKAGIGDFLQYWETKKEKFSISIPEGKNAVTLLTIHKSKGLEFPVVIFPFAEEDYVKSRKDKLWVENDFDSEISKVLIDHKNDVENYSLDSQKIFNEKNQEILLDNINIIYVAMTRAVEQLFIISSMNIKNGEAQKNNMTEFFIKFLENQKLFDPEKKTYEFGSPVKQSKTNLDIKKIQDIPVYQYTNSLESLKIATREGMMWGTERQKAIDYGNLMHKVMSRVFERSTFKTVINEIIQEGIIPLEFESKIITDVERIVNDDNLINFFSSNNEIFNERELIVPDIGTLKPDRVEITRDKKARILDYKTGKEESKHIDQILNYALYLKQMGLQVTDCFLVYISEDLKIIKVTQ